MKRVRGLIRGAFMGVTLLVLMSSSAWATYSADITYDYTTNGAGHYDFTYTVNNTSDGADTGRLDFFLLNFDADSNYSLYENVAWLSGNGWKRDAFPYDPAFGTIPASTIADDSVLTGGTGGIAQGDSLGNFIISFDYNGSLDPNLQLFSWYAEFGTSPDGHDIMGSAGGNSSFEGNVVPIPSTLLLLGSGLFGLFGFRRKS